MMKYEELVPQIMNYIGTETNIKSLAHCSTRLRFKFYDMSKVDIDALKALQGLSGVKVESDGAHLIVGQDVDIAYDIIEKNYKFGDTVHVQANKPATPPAPSDKFFAVMEWISGCLIPMLPALIASGLTTAVLTVLSALGWIETEGITYQVFTTLSSTVLKFIPILVVYGTAKKLEVNPIISFAVIGCLLSPDLWAIANDSTYMNLFGFLPIRVFSYSSTIFPAILCVIAQKYIQIGIKKIVPKMFAIFLEPLLTFLLLVVLMLVVLGPIGAYVGDLMSNFVLWGSEDYKWLICLVLAGFGNFLVGSGLHYCLIPVVIMIFSQTGYDSFYGGACFAGAFSLLGATLAVSFKTKNREVKQFTTSTGITALIGVAEPAIYGVFFKYKAAMIANAVAGCIAGAMVGILGCNSYGMAPAGITTIMLFAGDTFVNFLIIIATAFCLSFGICYALYDDKKEGVEVNVA